MFSDEREEVYKRIVTTADAKQLLGAVLVGDCGDYDSLPRALLDSFFQVASILTTTGFATADYAQWAVYSPLTVTLLFVCLFFGGMAGSTTGRKSRPWRW